MPGRENDSEVDQEWGEIDQVAEIDEMRYQEQHSNGQGWADKSVDRRIQVIGEGAQPAQPLVYGELGAPELPGAKQAQRAAAPAVLLVEVGDDIVRAVAGRQ